MAWVSDLVESGWTPLRGALEGRALQQERRVLPRDTVSSVSYRLLHFVLRAFGGVGSELLFGAFGV